MGKRDSTASSTSDSGGGPANGRHDFAALIRPGRPPSPVSSVSTESSSEGPRQRPPSPVVRAVSPLPRWVRGGRGEERGEEGGPVKPCTPKAFKFYMEQHVENVIKQHNERQMRYFQVQPSTDAGIRPDDRGELQLEKEMASAKFQTGWRCQMKKLLATKESHYLRRRRQKMDKSMFQQIKVIGVGAFGTVSLVRKKDTKVPSSLHSSHGASQRQVGRL